MPFDLQRLLFGIVENQPPTKTALAGFAGLIVNGFSPNSGNVIGNHRGSGFFPRQFLVNLDGLATDEDEQRKHAHEQRLRSDLEHGKRDHGASG